MRWFFGIAFLIVITVSCEQDKKVERGFYYWKSDFSISDQQSDFLEKMNAEVLFVHFFDVVISEENPVPVAEIKNYKKTDFPVVPVVYITTDVFIKTDSMDIPDLAEKVYSKITTIYGAEDFAEIQIDCDWMPSIQEKYFYFLAELKKLMSDRAKLSATVRLYQFKYPDLAGVPPVDRGLLMYYNMGDLTNYKEPNSILNNEIGEQYLIEKKYPLPLDIALPNFSWSLLFREGDFLQICPQFSEGQLKNDSLFVSNQEDHYIFTKDTVMYEMYFRFGDELRYESCSEDALITAAEMLKDKIETQESRILIYHLQEKTISDYEKLDAVYSVFE